MERDSEATLFTPFVGPPPGTVLLDKYRIDGTIGSGGFGLVLLAHNLALDEAVAMKILRDEAANDPENVQRFLREAQAVVRLSSIHVTRVRDVGLLANGAPYMVMELLDGHDLGAVLTASTRLPANRAVDYILHTCDALAEAHSIGIVHRDIKPTNLFLTKRAGGGRIVKVLDFGISKVAAKLNDLSLTQSTSVLGTPAYMSPEQMRSARDVDARTDIWSLGCVLFELVEGKLPFEAATFAELCVIVATEPPAQIVNAPRELARVILRCLAKQPDDRYQSIGELASALASSASPAVAAEYVPRIRRVLALAPESPVARRVNDSHDRPRGRRIVLAGGVLAVAVASFLVVLALASGRRETPAAAPIAVPTAPIATPPPIDAASGSAVVATPDGSAGSSAAPTAPVVRPTGRAHPPVPPGIAHRPASGAGSAGTPHKAKCDPYKSIHGSCP